MSDNKSAGVWVNCSERMPEQGGGYFARSNIQNDFREPFILEYNGQSLHDIEWLDESQQPDNTELVEALESVFKRMNNKIPAEDEYDYDPGDTIMHLANLIDEGQSILNKYKK